MSIRVLLVDDHKIIREGLRSLLSKTPDIEVVAEAENGRMARQLAQEMMPDVIVMDISMPGLNGIEATRQILAAFPDIKVITLSMHPDNRLVVGMLDAGASGYVLKDCTFEELEKAIRTAMADQIYLSPRLIRDIVEYQVRNSSQTKSSPFSILTSKEREVLQLVVEGRNTKQIAWLLNVSVKTVETHRNKIMTKLNIHSISGLTKYALREGLTSLDDK
jgi:DNA-binding NarL/FixJ family response regulator